MPTAILPDIAKLAGDYLRTRSEVLAITGTATPGKRISARHPREQADPWVRIIQITGTPQQTPPLHFGSVHLQLDCYGGDEQGTAQAEASLLARTCQAILNEMPQASHSGAVVTRVAFSGPSRQPDPNFTPARERYVLEAFVYSHPA